MVRTSLATAALAATVAVLALAPDVAEATTCASPDRFKRCLASETYDFRGKSVLEVSVENSGPACVEAEIWYPELSPGGCPGPGVGIPTMDDGTIGPQDPSQGPWCHLEALTVHNHCSSEIRFDLPALHADDTDVIHDFAVPAGEKATTMISRNCAHHQGHHYWRERGAGGDASDAGSDASMESSADADSGADASTDTSSDADAASHDADRDGGAGPTFADVCEKFDFDTSDNPSGTLAYSHDGATHELRLEYDLIRFQDWYSSWCDPPSLPRPDSGTADGGGDGGGNGGSTTDTGCNCTSSPDSPPNPEPLAALLLFFALTLARRPHPPAKS